MNPKKNIILYSIILFIGIIISLLIHYEYQSDKAKTFALRYVKKILKDNNKNTNFNLKIQDTDAFGNYWHFTIDVANKDIFYISVYATKHIAIFPVLNSYNDFKIENITFVKK